MLSNEQGRRWGVGGGGGGQAGNHPLKFAIFLGYCFIFLMSEIKTRDTHNPFSPEII